MLRRPEFYIALFFIINLLQSIFTGLLHDEAYYWVYAQNLDWGYFDHPPGIAVLIALGSSWISGELGLRFFTVIASTLSLWLIWKIINPQKPLLFFALFFSFLIAHVGFIAVPDIPLLLFTCLFFYILKFYLDKNNWITAVLLGAVVAAMGYSKYHGIIVLIPALLANLYLLKRGSFWLLVGVASALFFPHLYWQYVHDFPTFRFHLFDRSSEPYSFLFILEYLLGQLLLFGPLTGFLAFWMSFKYNNKNIYEKTMRWCFLGIFGFFFLMAFRGRVEPNWTIAGIVPLLFLTVRYLEENATWEKWMYRLSVSSIFIFLIARILIVFAPGPLQKIPLISEMQGWDIWAKDIQKVAGEHPVIFYNNYQRAAKYAFYTGQKSHSLNTAVYAGSQYDLLVEQQEKLQGTTVCAVQGAGQNEAGFSPGKKEKIKYTIIENFRFYHRAKISVENFPETFSPGASLTTTLSLFNPTEKTIEFLPNKEKELKLKFAIFDNKKFIKDGRAVEKFSIEKLEPGEIKKLEVQFSAPEKAGDYRFRFCINNGYINERNMNFIKFKVE